jgi:hypothetical protein
MGALATPPEGRNRRISSNEQPNWNDGNFDMTRLKPSEVFELPLLEGCGVINHIWMTSHAGGVNELNAITLRIYWDGCETPGIEVPLADFFAVGQGTPHRVESFPVQVSPTGSLSCYWRMPFAKSARIVISNDNHNRASGLYWQVDWVELESLPENTPYFYARYRQEYPAVMGQDYLLADLEGQGKYVGTVLSVTMAQDGWFGEGDDFFYIDGEEIPSLQGTGSEDYFNDAWGYRERNSIWFGQPRWQGYEAGDCGVCYRWHILDPVGFEKSLKVTIEHKGNCTDSEDGFFIERPDFFSSVAFWYQTGTPKPFGYLPPFPERCVPWVWNHAVRAFRFAKPSEGTRLHVETQGFFGSRPSLFWSQVTPESRLDVPFSVSEEGNHALRLTAFTAPEMGVFSVLLDGEVLLEKADFCSAERCERDLLLGTRSLTAGEHTLTFQPQQAGSLALEFVRALRLPPPGKRDIKNDNEAHFIRLGVGRATYAYRLAYDALPDTLEVLVEAGFMTERYLKDENGYPLRSYREGEYLMVESTAPNGWTSRWLGADARR